MAYTLSSPLCLQEDLNLWSWMLSCEAVLFCVWQPMDLIIFLLDRYTVLDPSDLPPVAITTTETSATIATSATTVSPTTAGSSAPSVSLGTKKSTSVSIPMVVGIAVAIGVVAIVILVLLCCRIRRAVQVSGANEQAEVRIYSPETPPDFQPSKPIQQSGIITSPFVGSRNTEKMRSQIQHLFG